MQETGCPPTASKSKLHFETVDFSELPGQSKLFLQYQNDPLSLKKYYPSAVSSHVEVSARISEIVDAHVVDRDQLCDVLEAQNRSFGAGVKTFESIELLRSKNTVAILTGQQAGLFTGPMYTIYKALSAIKLVECFRDRGIDAVAVFWAATEDHDFEEISKAFWLDAAGELLDVKLDAVKEFEGRSVGSIPIPASFEVKKYFDALPATEFKDEVRKMLADVWKPGRVIGQAFCTHIQRLFAEYGLIVVDPLDLRLKKLVAPIYAEAVNGSEEIVSALVDRSRELETNGYQAQVLVTPDYFPLFYHTEDGVRHSVRQKSDGKYRIVDTKLEFTRQELAAIAAKEPQRFSPGVMLRPVVQDYLFPTACYFGGGAEIAYFAQNSKVYEILGRPVTPILHRQSFTVVEAKHARTLEKYDLVFADLFAGFENVLPKVVERFVNPTTARVFADAEENINLELNRLDQELSRIDPTLADNLATRRRKILYHIGALRKKFHRVQLEHDEIVNRQIRTLFASLLPDGQLQERKLNIASFMSRHGSYFIDWIYDSIDLDERGHRVLYL